MSFQSKILFKFKKRYITSVITHNWCNICFYPVFLSRALTLHSRYYKFSRSRVHFASANAAASSTPNVTSLLFRSLHRESIHTKRDSFVHAFWLFRCHFCCCFCRLCRHILSIATIGLCSRLRFRLVFF